MSQTIIRPAPQAGNPRIIFFVLLSFLLTGAFSAVPSLEPLPDQINAVRFDPSYYYQDVTDVQELCTVLLDKWRAHGVNTVFFKVYDPLYGAKYQTEYSPNIMTDFGRLDLLGHMLEAAAPREIKIIAWIPAFLHKQAWEKNEGWRVKLQAGVDYQPDATSYFICPANPAVQAWWNGFLADLISHYPGLAGIDIAEPIVSWQGSDCFCDYCSGRPAQASIDGLSSILKASVRQCREASMKSCVTTVAATDLAGYLLSNERLANQTGFDLEALLSGSNLPDWLNFELMWQQWADRFADTRVFTPQWAGQTARSLNRQWGGKTRLLAHLELTSFGRIRVDPAVLRQSVISARDGGLADIDVYDTHLLDSEDGWLALKEAFTYVKTKKVLVCHDEQGTNDARQLASLISHFHADYALSPLKSGDQLSADMLDNYDQVFFCRG